MKKIGQMLDGVGNGSVLVITHRTIPTGHRYNGYIIDYQRQRTPLFGLCGTGGGIVSEPTQLEPLKPCPWCGGEAEVNYHLFSWEPKCMDRKCPGRISFDSDTREGAIAAWNERAGEADRAALTARVAELEAENDHLYGQVRMLPVQWGLEVGALQTRIAELEVERNDISLYAQAKDDVLFEAQQRIAELEAQVERARKWLPESELDGRYDDE